MNNSGTTVLTCLTTAIDVTAEGGVTYAWSGSLGNNAGATITTAGTYTVTVTNAGGCSATASITVTQAPGITSVVASAGTITTNGGTTTLTATVTGGTAPYTYSLNGGAFQNGNTFTIGAGTYTVTAKDVNGCTATSNTLTVTQPAQGNRTTTLVYTGSRTVQYGSQVSLSAVLRYSYFGIGGRTITFTIGTQTITAVTNLLGVASTTMVIDQAPGNYQVVTTFAGDATYRASNDRDSFTITRKPLTPGLTGTVSKQYDGTTRATLTPANYTLTGVINGDDVSLNNPANGTYDSRNVGTNKRVTVTGLALVGTNAGYYRLTTTSVNARIGIITPVRKSATISAADTEDETLINEPLYEDQECTMIIPNGFSPDGDGINELFKITCMEAYPDARITIFNAANQLVFEKDHYGNIDYWSTELDAWWDGTDNVRSTGTQLPSGTYIYILELKQGDRSSVKKGTIFLFR